MTVRLHTRRDETHPGFVGNLSFAEGGYQSSVGGERMERGDLQIQTLRIPDRPKVDGLGSDPRERLVSRCKGERVMGDVRRSRNDGRLLMPQESPINGMEPPMLLQLARSALTPKSLVLVLAQELLDDALAHGRCRRMVGERNLVAEDVAEGLVSVRALEWSAAVEHLEDEDADCPPARRVSVRDRTHQRRGRTSRQQTSASLE